MKKILFVVFIVLLLASCEGEPECSITFNNGTEEAQVLRFLYGDKVRLLSLESGESIVFIEPKYMPREINVVDDSFGVFQFLNSFYIFKR